MIVELSRWLSVSCNCYALEVTNWKVSSQYCFCHTSGLSFHDPELHRFLGRSRNYLHLCFLRVFLFIKTENFFRCWDVRFQEFEALDFR